MSVARSLAHLASTMPVQASLGMSLYVIAECACGPCKVGFARDPAFRASTLQSGNPRQLKLFYGETSLKWYSAERVAHNLLWRRQVSGEWFDVPVLAAISAVRAGCEMVAGRKRVALAEFRRIAGGAILDEGAPK